MSSSNYYYSGSGTFFSSILTSSSNYYSSRSGTFFSPTSTSNSNYYSSRSETFSLMLTSNSNSYSYRSGISMSTVSNLQMLNYEINNDQDNELVLPVSIVDSSITMDLFEDEDAMSNAEEEATSRPKKKMKSTLKLKRKNKNSQVEIQKAEADIEVARAEMKEILKTLPSEFEMRYDKQSETDPDDDENRQVVVYDYTWRSNELVEREIQPLGDYKSLLNFAIENEYRFGKLKNNIDDILLYETDEEAGEFSE
ncbi:12507_t:CDS:2 [Funneliformis caledonium]|uniref:12507_t:CDS:1 n=1 Tax=Funneliformis caledonium TaxID=1117310 RepID=A0A9N9EN88_9GLOM|nr:12507_t:CDS:2 [Funneliformis caledonium]